jgi:hypothetical protein
MFPKFLNPHMNASFVRITTTLKFAAKAGVHCNEGFCSVPQEPVSRLVDISQCDIISIDIFLLLYSLLWRKGVMVGI